MRHFLSDTETQNCTVVVAVVYKSVRTLTFEFGLAALLCCFEGTSVVYLSTGKQLAARCCR